MKYVTPEGQEAQIELMSDGYDPTTCIAPKLSRLNCSLLDGWYTAAPSLVVSAVSVGTDRNTIVKTCLTLLGLVKTCPILVVPLRKVTTACAIGARREKQRMYGST